MLNASGAADMPNVFERASLEGLDATKGIRLPNVLEGHIDRNGVFFRFHGLGVRSGTSGEHDEERHKKDSIHECKSNTEYAGNTDSLWRL